MSKEEQALLLELARVSIHGALRKGRKLPAVESLSPKLREKRGVFVTLWLDGLRGCIGFPYPVLPLAGAVQEAAVGAALRDGRFPPVRPEELPRIEIEISALTVPRPLEPGAIRIGVHGLIVAQGRRSGLLLPQVAMEYRWDIPTFLKQTCVKAGLPENAWEKGAELLGFEAQVFSEGDLREGGAGAR